MPESPLFHSMLSPVLALVVWSLIVWAVMVPLRIATMARLKMPPQSGRHTDELTTLPSPARDVADNYNHLMEQPTIFYALALYTHLAGNQNGLNIALAWAYVAIRMAHSVVQGTVNNVMLRFALFVLSTLALIVLAGRNVFALLSYGA